MTSRNVEVPASPDVAYKRLLQAAASIGKVEEASPGTRSVVMKARYGLNPVRLRVSVLSGAGGSSIMDIQARGQDVWGVASRTVIDRLIDALGAFPPQTAGVAPAEATPTATIGDELQRIADLHSRGLLSEEEFAAAKRRILGA